MKHGSLFNGIGGFQLAATWMGWDNIFSCEIDNFCNKVTKQHFPNCIQHGDIKTTDFTIYRGRIDILTGGFPCQPFSAAGKRKGISDPRHLWPEMLRAIGEIQPTYIVGENVYGITNWAKGLVFEQVCADLENAGYEVQPVILPACGKNANHKRDRVWFIAHLINARDRTPTNGTEGQQAKGEEWRNALTKCSGYDKTNTPNNNSTGLQEARPKQQAAGIEQYRKLDNPADLNGDGQQRIVCQNEKHTGEGREYALNDIKQGICDATNPKQFRCGELELQPGETIREVRGGYVEAWDSHWQQWPIEPTICGDNDGIPNRVDRIKALGNAIVPQIAFEIFKAIEATKHNPHS